MLLFLYGTLKRGGSNHRFMAGQRFVGTAATQPCYSLFDLGGYPGMVGASPGAGRSIDGEVWEVDAAALARLDVLEDIENGEYIREPILLDSAWLGPEVQGYRFLLSVAGCPDLGSSWPVEGREADG